MIPDHYHICQYCISVHQSIMHVSYQGVWMWCLQRTLICLEDRKDSCLCLSLPSCLSLPIYFSFLSPSIFFWQQQQAILLLCVHALQLHLVNQAEWKKQTLSLCFIFCICSVKKQKNYNFTCIAPEFIYSSSAFLNIHTHTNACLCA